MMKMYDENGKTELTMFLILDFLYIYQLICPFLMKMASKNKIGHPRMCMYVLCTAETTVLLSHSLSYLIDAMQIPSKPICTNSWCDELLESCPLNYNLHM